MKFIKNPSLRPDSLRVCPETLGGVAKFSKHEADGSKTQECEPLAIEILPILGQPAAAVEPGNSALDNPALGKHGEFVQCVALDDLDLEIRQEFGERSHEFTSLITGIGKELLQERVHSEQSAKQQDAAVAVLDVRSMNLGVQQQTQRVYQDMALLALDLLARIIAMRIDAGPPFSALFTLWLSMMAALGLASRSSLSRHATYSA